MARAQWRRSAVFVVIASASAAAQDAFEIQVYDARTAAPGQVGAELHLNHFFVGSTSIEGSELPTNHVTHLTFEPHVGLAEWCEAGAYISTAVRASGTFDLASLKLRFKARWPTRLWGRIGLALNQELSATRLDYAANGFAWEIRPVIDFEWKRLYVSANPIVSVPLGGADKGTPELEPCAKVALRALEMLSIGVEYYGALGPIARMDTPASQVHRLFGALDFDWRAGRRLFELNLALGYGLSGPERWIAKATLAFDVEPEASRPSAE